MSRKTKRRRARRRLVNYLEFLIRENDATRPRIYAAMTSDALREAVEMLHAIPDEGAPETVTLASISRQMSAGANWCGLQIELDFWMHHPLFDVAMGRVRQTL